MAQRVAQQPKHLGPPLRLIRMRLGRRREGVTQGDAVDDAIHAGGKKASRHRLIMRRSGLGA
jgi:hypothetical protein